MNGLPTHLNLEKRGIRINGLCPLCKKGLESIKHALIHCSKAWEVWWNWQTCPINLGDESLDITNIALRIMENETSLDLEIFLTTAWSIWYNRNQVVHKHSCLPSSQVWNYAQRMQSDYKGAITANLLRQQPLDVSQVAPPPNTHKINVDGATSEDGRLSGVGVVICDCKGTMIAARSKQLDVLYDVETTEAFALENRILLASELMIPQVIIESDSLAVVQAVNSRSFHGTIGPIIQGALSFLSQFRSQKVLHLKKDYNKVAHELAQYARKSMTTQTWIGAEPPMFHSLFVLDRSKCQSWSLFSCLHCISTLDVNEKVDSFKKKKKDLAYEKRLNESIMVLLGNENLCVQNKVIKSLKNLLMLKSIIIQM